MRWLTWPFLDRYRDHGLLLLRVGLGLSFVAHGWPKLAGGAAKWEKLGGTMKGLGITFAPTFWGLAAALAETVGGLLFAVGLATRPVAAMLAFTMFVAVKMHVDAGDGFIDTSHSLEAMVVFLAMVLVGPGRFSLDARRGGR